MKQNIYDNPEFFEKYKNKRVQNKGSNRYLEIPSFRTLRTNAQGLSILDIGCGWGDLSFEMALEEAENVLGVDISTKMIYQANQRKLDNLSFECVPFEDFQSDRVYDLITSSLSLHYIENIQEVFSKCCSLLKPNGEFVFSMEHPVITCNPGGVISGDDESSLTWEFKNYGREGKRSYHWNIDGVVNYHRKFSTIINSLVQCGFKIVEIVEPEVSQDDLVKIDLENKWPFQVRADLIKPTFILYKVQKIT